MGEMEGNRNFKTCFEACFQPQAALDEGGGQILPVIQIATKGKHRRLQTIFFIALCLSSFPSHNSAMQS